MTTKPKSMHTMGFQCKTKLFSKSDGDKLGLTNSSINCTHFGFHFEHILTVSWDNFCRKKEIRVVVVNIHRCVMTYDLVIHGPQLNYQGLNLLT
jgi:hypothetical protein